MLITTHGGLLCLLACLPIIAAIPNPTAAPETELALRDLNLYHRGLFDPPESGASGSQTQTSSSSTTRNTDQEQETRSTPTSTSTPPTTTPTTPTSTPPTTTRPPLTTSSPRVTTDEDGQEYTTIVIVTATPSSSSATATNTADSSNTSTSSNKGTFIGLGVAGGIAVLGLAGFLVWKFTQKRFSQFDDDAGEINWPMPKEELKPPAAPGMNPATNATSSSIDLTRDAYAVPPLPQHTTQYYDDPSGTAAAAYYDPYRGPVPQTFYSPPQSTDANHQGYGEAIPMSTYSNGRQSPGPNMAYDDPYAGRRSPGPNLAYGGGGPMMDPTGRVGTPLSRVGTPMGGYGVQGIPPPGADMMRAGTPQGYGRASPGPGVAYGMQQQPLVNPYDRHTPAPYGS